MINKKEGKAMYLFACIKNIGVSKCSDASYSLLQVHEIYNDPDFAKFGEPLYTASKINGTKQFAATIRAGTDQSNLLGKIGQIGSGKKMQAEISDGVDVIAAICLGLSVNQPGTSTSSDGLSGASGMV
eukprot:CAMPEP_0178888998 /NCGR_PEP_ID=MMETSP0747-20121128/17493_1 /TAXON_ID=913974 /ORGANISM="Nitzschia punctata, Strain CCMP561" /LENGTH=127 /DNA_ID=CAMNT_0020558391 /DNA_START=27 /DNA_END=410 /DNA_ORIENTATION=+